MSEAKQLAEDFQTTHWLIGKFAAGMSHEDSVAQPPFKANNFNWVLGHILVSRDRAIRLVSQPPLLDDEETSLYATGSKPVNAETAVTLDRLMQVLDSSQQALVEGLAATSPEDLAELFDEKREQRVGDRIAGLHWHETYHVGQLEILRQVSREREDFP